MKTINILNFYGIGKKVDDLNKKRTLTKETHFCSSCEKDMPTIKSRYNNKPAQRCAECGKMIVSN